jgi:spermidine synthase
MNRAVSKTPGRLTGKWIYYLIFTISGFSGLIYESIWSHYLKLFLGHAAYAQSLVLVIFMGGMAVGAWVAGQYSTRWRAPILVYALVEAIIGLFALVFHGSFVAITDSVHGSLLPAMDSPMMAYALKWTIAALMIVPQSILLGMTFPLMTAGVIRRYPQQSGGTISLLYFTNSLGAAVGVLASGFWLIGTLGLPGTIMVAGAINVVLAAAVALIVRADQSAAVGAPATTPTNAAADRSARVMLAAAFVTGMASFIYEIGWIRMLSLVLSSATHAFELMLSAFILGLAFGGLFIRWWIDRIASPIKFAAYVQIAMGLLALLTLPLYGLTFDWMADFLGALNRTDENYKVLMLASHGVALTVMLPATFCAGMTLPLFTHALLKAGYGEKSIGRIYASNTLGSIAGVLFAVNVGLPQFGVKNLIGVGAGLDIALGVSLLYIALAPGRERIRAVAEALVVSVCAGAVLLVFSNITPAKLASGVFRYQRSEVPPNLTFYFYRDGKTASINVHGTMGKALTIGTNGKPDATLIYDPSVSEMSEEDTMILLGSMPFGYKPDAKRIAVIGMGSGLTTHTVLALPNVERVDTIEIEAAMVEAARLFGHRVARAYDDPRSKIHLEDAKTFFAVNNATYDVIISEPSNPWISGVSSLYSHEFYRQLRNYLTEDGVLVQWIHLYENDIELVMSILKAMDIAFSDYALYFTNSHDMLIVARKTGELGHLDTTFMLDSPLAKEMAAAGVITSSDLHARLIAKRRHLAGILAHSTSVPANSDFRPYLDQRAHRAFFKQQSVTAFTRRIFDFPYADVLNGDRPEGAIKQLTKNEMFFAAGDFQAASAAYRVLATDDATAAKALTADLLELVRDLRTMAPQCGNFAVSRQFRAKLHLFARFMIGALGSRQAQQLWQTATFKRCLATTDPVLRAWMNFYESVAARDFPRMVELARAMLQDNYHEGNRDLAMYLLSAGVVGSYMQQDYANVQAIWDKHVWTARLAESAPFYLRAVVHSARFELENGRNRAVRAK